MPQAAIASIQSFQPRTTAFETAFVNTVLEHRGLSSEPSLADHSAALEVLRRFEAQRPR